MAAFDGQIHGEGVAAMTRALILEHPQTRPHHWLFIEDQNNGAIVSSLGFIPWALHIDDLEIKSGEMGIVGTAESHRGRGLVRHLVSRHAALLQEEGCLLSHIQGIPYFYRQFGYEYAIPLESHWRLELHQAPKNPGGYRLRPADLQDIPQLQQLYKREARRLTIGSRRDAAIWGYLLGPGKNTETATDIYLLENTAGTNQGYISIPHRGFGDGVIVAEVAGLKDESARAVLAWLCNRARTQEKPYLRLNLPPTNTLVQTARSLGASDQGSYAWQIHLPDPGQLLQHLTSLFERRLAASPLAGETRILNLDLYRRAWQLRFDQGCLDAISPANPGDGNALRLPPLLAAPLLTGYRSSDELIDQHHDVYVDRSCQQLAAVLFPRVHSFIHTIY
ncbi:MAG: GNAT family N-acetyltransferase [Candidatus Latescibacteria bacterium]|nr:GNAT family N-acetyltransferase [Candidatus Latescibacterota bacterium]